MVWNSSPFTPGQVVSPGLFVGRSEEVQQIRQNLLRAQQEGLHLVFLQGEHGIGKSSLAHFGKFLAQRQHNTAAFHVALSGVEVAEDVTHAIFEQIVGESMGRHWYDTLVQRYEDSISQRDEVGVRTRLDMDAQQRREMNRHFASSLAEISDELGGSKDGMLLILDDVDHLCALEDFASWLSDFVRVMSSAVRSYPICMILVGPGQQCRNLIRMQPTLQNSAQTIELAPWSADEARVFFAEAFGGMRMTVESDTLDFLVKVSQGLPLVSHELGDAIYRHCTGSRVDFRDVGQAVDMASRIMGRKYVDSRVHRTLQKGRYQPVMRHLAKNPLQLQFEKEDIDWQIPMREAAEMEKFLHKCRQMGLVAPAGNGETDHYRFTSRLGHSYLHLRAVGATMA